VTRLNESLSVELSCPQSSVRRCFNRKDGRVSLRSIILKMPWMSWSKVAICVVGNPQPEAAQRSNMSGIQA